LEDVYFSVIFVIYGNIIVNGYLMFRISMEFLMNLRLCIRLCGKSHRKLSSRWLLIEVLLLIRVSPSIFILRNQTMASWRPCTSMPGAW